MFNNMFIYSSMLIEHRLKWVVQIRSFLIHLTSSPGPNKPLFLRLQVNGLMFLPQAQICYLWKDLFLFYFSVKKMYGGDGKMIDLFPNYL